jgi:hypothetical protein
VSKETADAKSADGATTTAPSGASRHIANAAATASDAVACPPFVIHASTSGNVGSCCLLTSWERTASREGAAPPRGSHSAADRRRGAALVLLLSLLAEHGLERILFLCILLRLLDRRLGR